MVVKHAASKASNSGTLSPSLCLQRQGQSVAIDKKQCLAFAKLDPDCISA